MATASTPTPIPVQAPVTLPRLTIAFCTQCRWNLRAAYYAQELLQTFGTTLGEVALVPSTGGTFIITLTHHPIQPENGELGDGGRGDSRGQEAGKDEGQGDGEVGIQRTVIWDRKVDGGFPETKVLKGRVRDLVEPGRALGHTDRALRKGKAENEEQKEDQKKDAEGGAEGAGGAGDGGKEGASAASTSANTEPQPQPADANGRDAEGNAERSVESQQAPEDCQDCR